MKKEKSQYFQKKAQKLLHKFTAYILAVRTYIYWVWFKTDYVCQSSRTLSSAFYKPLTHSSFPELCGVILDALIKSKQ